LLHNVPNITNAEAYDQARREFYRLRLREDVERRVAKEEAESTGAYFGKSMLEVGTELENKEYDRWLGWAEGEVNRLTQLRIAFSGSSAEGEGHGDISEIEEQEDLNALPSSGGPAALNG